MGDVASPFFPDVARGAEDVLAPAGYSLILSSSRRDPERELRNVRHLLERSTDGLILGAPQCPPDELAEVARRAGVPMVFLNREVTGPHVAAVWIDWPAATAEVATYLAGLGHRRVALIVPSRSDARVGNREDWYRPALARIGLGPERSLIFREAMSLEGGHRAGERLLALARPPDRGHLPQRRDGHRAPPGVRPARVRVPRRPLHRRLGRRALREPGDAAAHDGASPAVRARAGGGPATSRSDGRATRGRHRDPAGARAGPSRELRAPGGTPIASPQA